MAPSDCGYSSTTIKGDYDPGETLVIPVVVHVLQTSGGTGYVSPALVQSQIDILNEDFQALPGTPGQPGTNGKIQFELATVDPSGNATTGITYSNNTTWYNDGGSYWNTLAWDTNRYLNIYTNSAGGYLGYVPDLPQGGIVGTTSDRVVIYWASFGRNSAYGPPYDQGRTTTHEVGHYLGLYHTFEGGCGSGYTSGDRIADTASESSPTFGCPGTKSSCGSADPVHNYMDYSDDTCMWEFTPEQINRMRCTIYNYRPNLYTVGGTGPSGPGTAFCAGDGSGTGCPCNNQGAAGHGCQNSTGAGAQLTASGTASIGAGDLVLHGSDLVSGQSGLYFQGDNQISGGNGAVFGDGLRCTGLNTVRLQIRMASASGTSNTTVNVAAAGGVSAGQTKRYQLWYRDPAFSPCLSGFNLSNGYEVTWLP
ncbi:MAG: zinc metalloprotease [Planctomycetes bacterium]|nr:zinc metalloprotease [Planctomycetota bacterium]